MKTPAEKKERQILWLSFGSGLFFAAIEFLMAITSHSQSVLMDAAYDASELVVIALTLFLAPLFYKPISEKRPFGYAQVESIFIVIKGFMMLSVSLGLMVSNIQLALSGGNRINGTQVSLFQLALGTISLLVLLYMTYLNRSVSSPIVKSEIYGWKMDVVGSLGLSIAFFISTFLEGTIFQPILPYFDQIVALGLVILILPENIRLLWRAIKDVFLFAPEAEVIDEIKNLCEPLLEENGMMPTFYDITRTGRRLWVSVYFQTAEDTLSLSRLRQATAQLIQAIHSFAEDTEIELVPDTDFYPPKITTPEEPMKEELE